MEKIHAQKFLKKRKFMMVMPLLTVPFVTLAFWAMGGGNGNAQGEKPISQAGLNLQLPDANLVDESNQDKLSFYNKAQEDSIKLRQEMLNDPYYRNRLDTMEIPVNIAVETPPPSSNKLNNSPYQASGVTDPNEARIFERLDALNKAIQQPTQNKNNEQQEFSIYEQGNGSSDLSGDVDRLENMMQVMNDKGADDPEMRELGGMLDKIIDIQHPDRVKKRIQEKSIEKKTQVFNVNSSNKEVGVTFLGNQTKMSKDTSKLPKHNRFYDEQSPQDLSVESDAIKAVIHETKTVTAGSTVKLRLQTDIYVNGQFIPKGNFVFGTASFEGERLLINIAGVRHGNNLLPVALSVYDMDGIAGVYVPGSISRDVAKQSADQSLQSIELMSLDPSLKAQAATAGIQAAKGLLSKKVKLVKATIKAGYQVLLKDGNKQDN